MLCCTTCASLLFPASRKAGCKFFDPPSARALGQFSWQRELQRITWRCALRITRLRFHPCADFAPTIPRRRYRRQRFLSFVAFGFFLFFLTSKRSSCKRPRRARHRSQKRRPAHPPTKRQARSLSAAKTHLQPTFIGLFWKRSVELFQFFFCICGCFPIDFFRQTATESRGRISCQHRCTCNGAGSCLCPLWFANHEGGSLIIIFFLKKKETRKARRRPRHGKSCSEACT